MEPIKPLDVGYKNKSEITKPDGSVEKKERGFKLATEDIIAIFAGLIALVFALGMVFGKIPIDKLTIGVLSFSGIGAVIAEIIKAKRKRRTGKDK